MSLHFTFTTAYVTFYDFIMGFAKDSFSSALQKSSVEGRLFYIALYWAQNSIILFYLSADAFNLGNSRS